VTVFEVLGQHESSLMYVLFC